ncbi:MAG: hypothetical protein Fur0018_09530 [Anaerolineales bacterium]
MSLQITTPVPESTFGTGGPYDFFEPRAECYFALSEAFKEPTAEFARDVRTGQLHGLLKQCFEALGLLVDLAALRMKGDPETILNHIKRGYYPLFVVPPDFVMPVESVYKEWRGEGGFLAGARDMFMGPAAADMRRRYRQRGLLLDVPRALKDFPDHLALLLEYGGLLCREEDGLELADFVCTHFDEWIESFGSQVLARSRSPFYRTLTTALMAFIQYERLSTRTFPTQRTIFPDHLTCRERLSGNPKGEHHA